MPRRPNRSIESKVGYNRRARSTQSLDVFLLRAQMKKRAAFHIFGVISVLIIADFWVRYYAFCRFNTISPFNQFVHRWPFAGTGLLGLMFLAIVAPVVSAIANKWWLLISLIALGTLFFFYSQIT